MFRLQVAKRAAVVTKFFPYLWAPPVGPEKLHALVNVRHTVFARLSIRLPCEERRDEAIKVKIQGAKRAIFFRMDHHVAALLVMTNKG